MFSSRGLPSTSRANSPALLTGGLRAVFRAELIDADFRLQRHIGAGRQLRVIEGQAVMAVADFSAAAFNRDG